MVPKTCDSLCFQFKMSIFVPSPFDAVVTCSEMTFNCDLEMASSCPLLQCRGGNCVIDGHFTFHSIQMFTFSWGTCCPSLRWEGAAQPKRGTNRPIAPSRCSTALTTKFCFTQYQFLAFRYSLPASVCVCGHGCQPQVFPRDCSSPVQARTNKFGQKMRNNLVKSSIVWRLINFDLHG